MMKRSAVRVFRTTIIGSVVAVALHQALMWWYLPRDLYAPNAVRVEFEWAEPQRVTALRLTDPFGNRLANPLLRVWLTSQAPNFALHVIRLSKMKRGSAEVWIDVSYLPYPHLLRSIFVSRWRDPEVTALMRAAQSCNAAAVDRLVREGVDVNARDQSGATALSRAATCRNPEPAQTLIAAGAEVDARCGRDQIPPELPVTGKEATGGWCGDGMTPLMFAAWRLEPGPVDVLLAAGADVNATDVHGDAVLSNVQDRETIRKLLAHGADVNSRDFRGDTPLMNMAFSGDIDTAKVLLAAGADVNAKNSEGETALSIALKRGHSEMARVLRQAGSK